MQYPPYAQPPPPPPQPKPGLSTTAIVLIVIVSVGVLTLLIGVPLAIGIAQGYRNATRAAASAAAAAVDPGKVPLSATFAAPNGLVTAHYPEDFVGKKLDDATIVVSRNFTAGDDEVVTIAGVKNPVTNDARELGRLLLNLVEKNVTAKGGTSQKGETKPAKCLGKYDGVEWEGGFTIPGASPYASWACFFIRDDRGYEVRYDVPRSRTAAEVPLLERIVAATDVAP